MRSKFLVVALVFVSSIFGAGTVFAQDDDPDDPVFTGIANTDDAPPPPPMSVVVITGPLSNNTLPPLAPSPPRYTQLQAVEHGTEKAVYIQ